MNKKDLVKAVAEKALVNEKDTDAVIEAFTSIVIDEVAKGGSVALNGFGKFYSYKRNAKVVRNPKTGEMQTAKASYIPKFKPSNVFKGFVKVITK